MMDDYKQDSKFMRDILFEIVDYAKKNDMDPDDTIKTVAENMLAIMEIATFKGVENDT